MSEFRPESVPRSRVRTVAILPILTLSLAACGEWALTSPDVDLVTQETHPALEGTEEAPSLPDLVADAGAEEELGWAPGEWKRSWSRHGLEGRMIRARTYDRAVPALAAELEAARMEEAVETLGEVIAQADGLDTRRLPEALREELARARELEGEARVAVREGGEPERVLRHVLEAGDALRALSPESVAREMIRLAVRSVESAESLPYPGTSHGSDPATGVERNGIAPDDLERARRLARGADRAFERGNHRTAIQRAFYAHQIAENGGTR